MGGGGVVLQSSLIVIIGKWSSVHWLSIASVYKSKKEDGQVNNFKVWNINET